MTPTSTLYEQALAAWKAGDDEAVAEALFAFETDDGYYLEQVSTAIRALLQRPGLEPHQIVSIGRALLGLGRMPLRTPGLDLRITLVDKTENSAQEYSFSLTEENFTTDSGGYADFGFGGEAFGGSEFSVERYSRQSDAWSIFDERWPDVFREMETAVVQIEDYSDEPLLDWQHPDGSEFWEWITQHA